MDLINDFLYQIIKNTTIELKINIPISNTDTLPLCGSRRIPSLNIDINSTDQSNATNVVKSEDFLKQLFENLTTNTQEGPMNDDISTLISQLELVISTLRKILTEVKKQQTNNVMIDNYIEMIENIDKILKSFKLIRSFNF